MLLFQPLAPSTSAISRISFGTDAMALVMMVSVLAIGPIVNVWARPEAAPAFLGGLVSLATSSETFLAVAGALAASALALYVASCAACLAAYRRRDF